MRLPAVNGVCAGCLKPLPADGRFCSSCGLGVDKSGQKKARSSNTAEALLSEANLLRLRCDWGGAEARCLDVIRLDPNNFHAHTLLGDLYRDQRRFDDAAQWYQLALDLNPTSRSERAKLKKVEDELARQAVRAVRAGHSSRPPSGTQRLAGLPPSTWLNALWAALAIFMVASVILILGLRAKRNGNSSSAALRYGTFGQDGTQSEAARKGSGMFVLPTQRGLAAPANRTPAAPPLAQTDSTTSSESAISTTPLPGPMASSPARQGSSDSVVSSLTVNPAGDRAAVVLTQRASASDSVDSLRQLTVQNAYRAASSLFIANPSYQHLGVTVRLGANGRPVFAADVDRSALDHVVDAGDHTQMLAAFSNVWWNPDLLPALPNDSDGSPSAISSNASANR